MRTRMLECSLGLVAGMLAAPPAFGQGAAAAPQDPQAEPVTPMYLRDRGEGVATSMFGTYIRRGEWIVYPFV